MGETFTNIVWKPGLYGHSAALLVELAVAE